VSSENPASAGFFLSDAMSKDPTSGPAESRWPCLRAVDEGVVLELSVVPGAKRTELVGLHDGALRVRLAAPPVDGKANEALTAWLAGQLGLPRRDVSLLRGASARRKQMLLHTSMAQASAWLARALPGA
jgi:uncharacterized protein (TIGR00251 family)